MTNQPNKTLSRIRFLTHGWNWGVHAMVLGVTILMAGCRAHPANLAIMLVGDAISDADVQDRAERLLGKPAAAADAMFGERLDTIQAQGSRFMQVYPVQGDILSQSRYAVEVRDGRVVALTKAKFNADGVEDVIKQADLSKKLLGKNPRQCRIEGRLGRPILKGKSLQTGEDVFVYDVRNWTNLRNARYCVLRFQNEACRSIKLVGVSASTKEDPARR